MWYVGSKNRLSKELVPIIQNYINKDTKMYIEPFVGGANMIDKIQCNKRIGCDIHKQLIELLKYVYSENNPLLIFSVVFIKNDLSLLLVISVP